MYMYTKKFKVEFLYNILLITGYLSNFHWYYTVEPLKVIKSFPNSSKIATYLSLYYK